MLKTKGAKERAEGYYKSNPRECMPFERSNANKMDLLKKQITMHAKD